MQNQMCEMMREIDREREACEAQIENRTTGDCPNRFCVLSLKVYILSWLHFINSQRIELWSRTLVCKATNECPDSMRGRRESFDDKFIWTESRSVRIILLVIQWNVVKSTCVLQYLMDSLSLVKEMGNGLCLLLTHGK